MIHKLERDAIELLLAGDDLTLAALRRQYEESQIESIELTGVGAYINYIVPTLAVNLPQTCSFCFGDIEGMSSSLKHGFGVLLWIKNGALSSLEIYTYDDVWPEEIIDFQLNYFGGKRDISKLRKSWDSKVLG